MYELLGNGLKSGGASAPAAPTSSAPLVICMGANRGLNQPVPLRGLRAYFLGNIISRQIFIA